jgi:uncharacterized protein (TIRG00374 family)
LTYISPPDSGAGLDRDDDQAALDSVDPETPESSDAARVWSKIPRRTLTIALSVLPIVALVNVGVLVWSLGGIDLSERLVRPGLLWLVALLVFVPMLANSLRLAIWARFLGLDLGFARSLKVITGAMITNSVTPSATGGMPIKLLFLMGEGVDSRRALTLISFQAAEDTLVMFSLVGMCLGITGFALFEFLGSDPMMVERIDQGLRTASMIALWSLVAVAVLALLVAAGMLGYRVQEWAKRGVRRVRGFLRQIVGDWRAVFVRGKAVALLNLGLGALQWIVRFSIAGLVLAAFGVEWQPALFWLLQYLVQSISSIVPTPGGAGGAEAGFLLLFAPFVEVDMLVPAMSTWRLMFFYMPLGGAALIFFLLNRRARAREKAAERARAEAQPLVSRGSLSSGEVQPAE